MLLGVTRPLLSALLALPLLAAACAAPLGEVEEVLALTPEPGVPAATSGPAQAAAMAKGVSLSPRGFEPREFTEFFLEAQRVGSHVSWAGDWQQLGQPEGSPYAVAAFAGRFQLTPVILTGVHSGGPGRFELLRPLGDDTIRAYVEAAARLAARVQPQYLGLGVEVDVLAEESPQDFERFVGLFERAHAAVREVSPQTRVFPTFQLERLQGLGGGLYGGENDPSAARWHLLDRFPAADAVGLTSYPGLVYPDPLEVPAGHYAEVSKHTEKPIVIVEVGWSSGAEIPGWESSEAEQADFVERLFVLLEGLDPQLVLWSFLYDQEVSEPFASMGLIHRDGRRKAAWVPWTTLP